MNVAALPSPCLSHFSILIVPESNSIHHQRITSRRVRLRPHLEVIRLILLHVHAVMQIRSGSSQIGAESAVSPVRMERGDRKSTRLNSSHQIISYAVFCLKKKKTETRPTRK